MIQDGTINERTCSPRRSTAYWLLVRSETEDGCEPPDGGGPGWAQAHTVELEGLGEALALFSFEEEARMFVWCGKAEAGWHPRRFPPEELLQMLVGAHASPRLVVLDPLPEPVAAEITALVSLSRERFVDRLIVDLLRVGGPDGDRLGSSDATRERIPQ